LLLTTNEEIHEYTPGTTGLLRSKSTRLPCRQRTLAIDIPPPTLRTLVRTGLAAVSALLIGAGLVCWIAANWASLGRPLQFGLLELLVLLPCFGATFWPALRIGLTVFAFMAIGAMFAYFGQTYQTGADPWQLFALWSALGLPLVLVAKSETLRVAWVIVAMTCIGLWLQSVHFSFLHASMAPALLGCAAALSLALILSRPLQRFTSAGPYASGVAIVAALCLISMEAFPDIINDRGNATSTLLVLLMLPVAAFYARTESFDIVALCACALAFNFLVDTAIVTAAFGESRSDVTVAVFTIGIVASGLCGLSVAAILLVMRRQVRAKGNQ
jgi:uncharacterized membrane protein